MLNPPARKVYHHYYEICEPLLPSSAVPNDEPLNFKSPSFKIQSPSLLRSGQRNSGRSQTPDIAATSEGDTLSANHKRSESEMDLKSAYARRYTTGTRKLAPPKPPKYTDPDETTTYIQHLGSSPPSLTHSSLTHSSLTHSSVRRMTEASSSLVSAMPSRDAAEGLPPPLPSQPIPKRKSKKSTKSRMVRGPLRADSPSTITTPPNEPVSEVPSATEPEPIYDFIKDEANLPSLSSLVSEVTSLLNIPDEEETLDPRATESAGERSRHQSSGSYGTLSPDSPARKSASSSLMFRRASSDRFKHRVSPSDVMVNGSALHRTPSLDKLDDRMDHSARNSVAGEFSSSEEEEEDESGILSPVPQGLPELPGSSAGVLTRHKKRVERAVSCPISSDDEPLYQYINTAAFLNSRDTDVRSPLATVPTGPSKTQLEVARELDSQRKLWCEQQEVIESGVLDTLHDEEKKLQEAMFEVITSEATYLRSLNVLIEHFMDDPGMNPNLPEGRRVLDRRQHHVIFSNIREVRDISMRFLDDLQKRQRESAVVSNIADIILDYAEQNFDCYVRYCTNQIYQTRELTDCLENNLMFREYLRRLESSKRCQNLSMQSFLLLPMQRITRMPLLILAILNRTPLEYPDYDLVEKSLRTVQKLVTACNDGARKMERTEQLHTIAQKINFGKKLKPFPLVSVSRHLERKGALIKLQVEQKLFGKQRIKKIPVYLFVFTDYVLITHRKKDPRGGYMYRVKDHASRAVVEVEELACHHGVTFPKRAFGEQDHISMATWAVSTSNVKNAFLVVFLDNAFHQTERYIFVAQNNTDKTRWMEAISRPDIEREGERIYQHWDCPQVQAVYDYQAQQPDELGLVRGDIIKVYRKMVDGWYEGERLRDLQWGWFPSNFTVEVANEHTRARNLRETHKLLSLPFNPEEFTANFLR